MGKSGIDTETMLAILKFVGLVALIMFLIYLVTLLTPKIAKLIDKHSGKPNPERVEEDSEVPQVKGPYDKSQVDEFDPNYKIYNTDIYSFNSKKKQKDKSVGDIERNVDNGKKQ